MNGLFSDRARKVLQLANVAAQQLNHEYIGTEHILLGLIREGSGVTANMLKLLDRDLGKIRLEIQKRAPCKPNPVMLGRLLLTPQAKMAIEYSLEEAQHMGCTFAFPEHILLGLLRAQEGVAAQVLTAFGLNAEELRVEIGIVLQDPCDS